MQTTPAHEGTQWREKLTRMLINRNPFYLLSIAFVFHGSSRWFQSSPNHDPLILMGLVSSLVLMMAGTAFAIVRWGNVWDDARSIFVLLPVLFVELALAFDETLVFDPKVGIPLVIAAYALCVLVIEGLLLGLRIRLKAAYRVPLHLMLALMFLYPLTLLASIRSGPNPLTGWQLFAFSVLTGLAVLSLVPAVRRGRDYVANNGTPWAWPVFPWLPVFFIAIGLCARAYAACISFDPSWTQSFTDSMKLQSVFAGYFAVPVVLAIAVLFAEAGRKTHWISLALPVVALWLSVLPTQPSMPQAEFAGRFQNTLGSPLFVCLLLACLFYGYTVMRNVTGARIGLSIATLLTIVVDPQTVDLSTLTQANSHWVLILALTYTLLGRKFNSTWQVTLGLAIACVTLHAELASFRTTMRLAIELHMVLFAAIAISLVTGSKELKALICGVVSSLCVGSLFSPAAAEFGALRVAYALAWVLAIGFVAIRFRSRIFTMTAACIGTALLGFGVRAGWDELRNVRGIGGLVFYAIGIIWFFVALAISMTKSRWKRTNELQ